MKKTTLALSFQILFVVAALVSCTPQKETFFAKAYLDEKNQGLKDGQLEAGGLDNQGDRLPPSLTTGDGGQIQPPPATGDGGQTQPPPATGDGGQIQPPPATGDGGQIQPPPATGDGGQIQPPPADNIKPVGDTVCDPLSLSNEQVASGSNIGSNGTRSGLIAELYYLTAKQPRFGSTAEYLVFGKKSPNTIFFNELYVPTRLFKTGFPLPTGGFIKDDEGNDLFEYFALKIFTTVSLGPNDSEGEYEFALIADDGAVWKFQNESNILSLLVNNDYTHPSKMGCSVQTIKMDRSTKLKSIIEYYQGPRVHIALIPMWRKIEGARMVDPICNQNGNALFFDYNKESSPKKTYLDLLERGWKPLSAANYSLPASVSVNPCINK